MGRFLMASFITTLLVSCFAGYPTDEEIDEWVKSNTTELDNRLIDFKVEHAPDGAHETVDLPFGWDYTSPEINKTGDTLQVSFMMYMGTSCEIVGNILHKKDTVIMQLDDMCHPDIDLLSEEALFKFTYKIRDDGSFDKVNWIAMYSDLSISSND